MSIKMGKRTLLRTALALSAAPLFGLAAAPAEAQTAWPTRQVRVVVPFGPGTAIDIVMRHLTEALAKQTGQTFVVENRAGASGTIGTASVLNAPPDGYTWITDASTHTSAPLFLDKPPYDPVRDFAGVTTVTESTLVLLVPKSSGITSLDQLIKTVKSKPGAYNFASAGVGSSTHLTAEKLNWAAGLKAVHVPFKSTTDAMTELVAGRITYGYTGVATAVPLIRDGRLTPLVLNGNSHSAALPGIPTIAEAGLPNGTYPGWLGVMVPIKTPRDVINRIHQEIIKAMSTPDMKEKLAKAGTDAWTMTPDEFDAMRKKEATDNANMIKELGLKGS